MEHDKINPLWDYDMDDILRGYTFDGDRGEYRCLLCGEGFEKGRVYREKEKFYDAEKTAQMHIGQAHGSVFDFIIRMEKEDIDLSANQKKVLGLFKEGQDDLSISSAMGNISMSTVRSYRHAFKKKEKQAKLFLALMAFTKAAQKTEREKANRKFPRKHKDKIAVLDQLMGRLEKGRIYSEKEFSEWIQNWYDDHALVRRYLVDLGYVEREKDGKKYRVKGSREEMDKNNKKALATAYMEAKKPMGVFRIRNLVNGKVFIGSAKNLNAKKNSIFFQLEINTFKWEQLQQEYNQLGKENFVFEILEELAVPEGSTYFDVDKALLDMQEKWLENLQPFNEKGYHKP